MFRNLLGRDLINRRIEHPLFPKTVRSERRLLVLVAVGMAVCHFLVQSVQQRPDPPMLLAHDEHRPLFAHASFLFPQGEKELFLPDNMTLTPELKLLERPFGLGHIQSLQCPKRAEQFEDDTGRTEALRSDGWPVPDGYAGSGDQ